jgi:hypothetical protein
MNENRTLGDDLRSIDMKWIWIVVSVIVLLFVGITPWDIIISLIENQGIGENEKSVVGFVAGYTLPLTAGFFLIAFLVLTGKHRQFQLPVQLLGAAGILALTGFLAHVFGLGLPPDYKLTDFVGGYFFIVIPVFVLKAYLNSYGIFLMICALVIGAAAALHVERYLQQGP